MAENLQTELLQAVAHDGGVPDSGELASAMGADHNTLVGTIKSLLAYEMIIAEVRRLRVSCLSWSACASRWLSTRETPPCVRCHRISRTRG